MDLNPDIQAIVATIQNQPVKVSKVDVNAILDAVQEHDKELLLKGAKGLYGMSMSWALDKMNSDKAEDEEFKRDIALKVLGHSMPSEVTLHDAEAKNAPRLIIKMERPGDHIIEADYADRPFVRGAEPTERIP
jgi:hypothetical protein